MSRRVIVLCVLMLLIGGVIFIWRMTYMAPAWYEPPIVSDPAIIEFADRVEYNLVQQAQQVREPDDRWTLRIREEQINAWLAARLSKWIARESGETWPASLGTPQVHLTEDAFSVALPLIHEARTRYVVVRLKPQINEGVLTLELNRVALGRISLPGEPLANLLESLSNAAPQALNMAAIGEVIEALRNRESIDLVFQLTDGRTVRLMDLQIDDGFMDLTAITLED